MAAEETTFVTLACPTCGKVMTTPRTSVLIKCTCGAEYMYTVCYNCKEEIAILTHNNSGICPKCGKEHSPTDRFFA